MSLDGAAEVRRMINTSEAPTPEPPRPLMRELPPAHSAIHSVLPRTLFTIGCRRPWRSVVNQCLAQPLSLPKRMQMLCFQSDQGSPAPCRST
jgi:hypothetical protein